MKKARVSKSQSPPPSPAPQNESVQVRGRFAPFDYVGPRVLGRMVSQPRDMIECPSFLCWRSNDADHPESARVPALGPTVLGVTQVMLRICSHCCDSVYVCAFWRTPCCFLSFLFWHFFHLLLNSFLGPTFQPSMCQWDPPASRPTVEKIAHVNSE